MNHPDCPRCGREFVKKLAQFYWRGECKPGYVCFPCNSLWPVPGEEIEPLRVERIEEMEIQNERESDSWT